MQILKLGAAGSDVVKLQKRLLDAPSPPMTVGSKIGLRTDGHRPHSTGLDPHRLRQQSDVVTVKARDVGDVGRSSSIQDGGSR